jgi:hypothetical protein
MPAVDDAGPVGLLCPGCGEPGQLVISDHQAFCGNDDCWCFMWDPALTFSQAMADASEINLTGLDQ